MRSKALIFAIAVMVVCLTLFSGTVVQAFDHAVTYFSVDVHEDGSVTRTRTRERTREHCDGTAVTRSRTRTRTFDSCNGPDSASCDADTGSCDVVHSYGWTRHRRW